MSIRAYDGTDDKIVVDSDDLAYRITQEMQQYNDDNNYSDTVTGSKNYNNASITVGAVTIKPTLSTN